jgi:hypothetical protein
MPHSYTVPALSTLTLSLWVLGCGEEGTGPDPEPADVSGLYETTTIVDGPPTCTPSSAAEILAPVVGATNTRERFRVDERAGEITLKAQHIELTDGTPVYVDSFPSIIAPIASDGSISYELVLHGQYSPEGRALFQETTIAVEGKFDREANPISVILSGRGTNVFREGAVDGPVFATCVQQQTTTGARAGAWLRVTQPMVQ